MPFRPKNTHYKNDQYFILYRHANRQLINQLENDGLTFDIINTM